MEGFFRFPAADEAVKDIDLVAHVMAENGKLFGTGLYEEHVVLEETESGEIAFYTEPTRVSQ